MDQKVRFFLIEDESSTDVDESTVPKDIQCVTAGSPLELLVISGKNNNDAELSSEEIETTGQTIWKSTGNPTDAALLALFHKSGLDEKDISQKYQLQREYPFDSSLKRMSKTFVETDQNPGYIVFTKGATEMIIPRCPKIVENGEIKEWVPERKESLLKFINSFAELGYRILSFAYKRIKELPPKNKEERGLIESDLVYLGFVCLLDPPREDVKEAVGECHSAGITPIMITGDSKVTGGTIATQIGLLGTNQYVQEGRVAGILKDEEFEKSVVFGRVSPQDKQTIVERYQEQDRVVAMTGDGVNDALALSMADAGVAMGIAGTDVAKQVSDIIIADDSFSSVVTGIREGRGLYHKIRIMIFFYICVNVAEALVYFGGSLLPVDNFYLLNNWQRMYIFSIAHALPPMAIIFDRFSAGITERKPIDSEGIFSKRLVYALIITAVSLSVVLYIVYFLSYEGIIAVTGFNRQGYVPEEMYSLIEEPIDIFAALDWSHAKARTMMHTVIYLTESILVLSIRRIDKSLIQSFKEDRFWLAYLCVFSLPILHLCIMYVPGIQEIIVDLAGINFEIIQLDLIDWGICIVAASFPIVMLETYKWYCRKKGQFF